MLLRLYCCVGWFCLSSLLSSLPVDWMERGGHHCFLFQRTTFFSCGLLLAHFRRRLFTTDTTTAATTTTCHRLYEMCMRTVHAAYYLELTHWFTQSVSQWFGSRKTRHTRVTLTQVTSSMLFRNSKLCNQSADSYFQHENEWEYRNVLLCIYNIHIYVIRVSPNAIWDCKRSHTREWLCDHVFIRFYLCANFVWNFKPHLWGVKEEEQTDRMKTTAENSHETNACTTHA